MRDKKTKKQTFARLLPTVVLAALSSAPALYSAQLTLDFEAFSDLTELTTQVPGLTFVNGTVITSTGSLFADEAPPFSGIAVLLDAGGPIGITFQLAQLKALSVTGVSAYFTYVSAVTFEALAADGSVIGSATSAFSENFVSSGNAPNELLEVVAPDIRALRITGDLAGGSVTLDDLTVTFEPGRLSGVPEPQAWILMLGGIAALCSRQAVRRLCGARQPTRTGV